MKLSGSSIFRGGGWKLEKKLSKLKRCRFLDWLFSPKEPWLLGNHFIHTTLNTLYIYKPCFGFLFTRSCKQKSFPWNMVDREEWNETATFNYLLVLGFSFFRRYKIFRRRVDRKIYLDLKPEKRRAEIGDLINADCPKKWRKGWTVSASEIEIF